MSSHPSPGTYLIQNRVFDGFGNALALTFTGISQPVTVTIINGSTYTKQHWVIENHSSGLQFIKPRNDQSLEAGNGNTIVTLPAGDYVWNITQQGDYVITDGQDLINWGIKDVQHGAAVVPAEKSDDEKNRWIFQEIFV
ncbi:hypothetical protein NLI96_g3821 [Meripilus lineatus]|uniref:CCL2-like lectin domain-containing protein n=1 Tax=Meripilus lineatus TaxID=2056292 RepID=A0AAD5YKH3_9APHY|nr:hypothetical protein NLI96_g3821 [Physisporinus lineatus]